MALLALRTGLDERQRDYLSKIEASAKSLLGILRCEPTSSRAPLAPLVPLAGRRILLVEDNLLNQEIVLDLLEVTG